MSSSRRVMEILEGRAQTDYHALAIVIAGRVHRLRSADTLLVRRADGATVLLDMTDAEVVDDVDEEGDFSTLLRSGLAVPFIAYAPAHDVPARIHGLRIERGAQVAVLGRIDRGFEPGRAYRDAGDAVTRSVAVRLVAAGVGARAALTAKVSAARAVPSVSLRSTATEGSRIPLLLPAAMSALGACAALAGGALYLGAARAASADTLFALGLQLSAAGIYIAKRRRFLPDLRRPGEDESGAGMRTGLGLARALPIGLTTALVVVLGASASIAAAWGLASVSTLGLALALLVEERRAWRRLWDVARAPPVHVAGELGAMDGRVTRGTCSRTREHTIHRDSYEDSDGRSRTRVSYTYRDTVRTDTLVVALDDGGALDVHTHWGALAAEDTRMPTPMSLVETIGPGDRVRVVGRPSGEAGAWRLEGAGASPLAVFGSRTRRARAAAWRALVLHALTLVALLTIAVLGALAAAALATSTQHLPGGARTAVFGP
ncbi:MAG: hypothetical protein KF782_00060 [Labilithrix sp.]|nr:hypothetical protein [Labilithrix sp.]